LKFRTARTENTIDIVVEDIEARYALYGKRVARVYAVGLGTIVFQMWETDENEDRWNALLDVSRETVITVTGKPYKKMRKIYHGPDAGKEREVSYFDIETWTDNKTDSEPPDNITEVPY
jgi:hypothetical protein